MAIKTQRAARRTEGLSKAQIVEAAIAILDAQGDGALTFRALAAALSTGSGAIYWHLASRDDLLAAAADGIVAEVVDAVGEGASAREALRALALGLFDAIDAHPWLAAQLSRSPWQPASLRIFEGVGARVQAMGTPQAALFNAASALVSAILGMAGQNAANGAAPHAGPDRAAALGEVADQWARLDPAQHPFLRRIADQMRGHDDREQFLAGVDMILAGVATLR
jgi:AcrR family transcriptional regulator